MIVFRVTKIMLNISCCLTLAMSGSTNKSKNANRSECSTNGVCLPADYEKLKPPKDPMQIGIGIGVTQISEVDHIRNTVEVLVYLKYEWEDNRIFLSRNAKFERSELGAAKNAKNWYVLHDEWFHRLYCPEIFTYRIQNLDITQNLPHKKPNMGNEIETSNYMYNPRDFKHQMCLSGRHTQISFYFCSYGCFQLHK